MMRRQILWWALAAAASVTAATAAGCKFDRPPALVDADPGAPDGATGQPDSETGCTPDAIVCDDAVGRYTECSSAGVVTLSIECPLGCATDVEKCLDLNPSNGLAGQLDLASEGPALVFAGNSTIDSSTGMVTNNGATVVVPNDDVGGIKVFRFQSLSISGTLKVTGSFPLAFVVDGDVTIDGTVDVSADRATPGPGGLATSASCTGASNAENASPTEGAGGGGRYNPGGTGGASGSSEPGRAGGPMLRDDDVSPLQGGCAGGGIYESTGAFGQSSLGGGGGGALQIASRSLIRISGLGAIDASGGGGQAGPSTATVGGSGGGAGGAILLEAREVVLNGANVVLSTKGGGGAASSANSALTSGSDGGTNADAAIGGSFGTAGGLGGTETTTPTAGTSGASTSDGGGGGGSVGQVRVNNASESVELLGGAVIRSRYTVGPLPTREIPEAQ